ncbi:MAG: hypothetical protein ACKOWR_02520 [Micrococcales bacterium]
MQIINSRLDESCGDLTVAEALTFNTGIHSLELDGRLGQTLPASIGRGNPDFYLAGFSFNGQDPVNIHADDVLVVDGNFPERIVDNQFGITQNDFGSYPNQVNQAAQNDNQSKVQKKVVNTGWVENALHQIDGQKKISQTSPSDIGFRAKSLMHSPIITGDFDSQREASND